MISFGSCNITFGAANSHPELGSQNRLNIHSNWTMITWQRFLPNVNVLSLIPDRIRHVGLNLCHYTDNTTASHIVTNLTICSIACSVEHRKEDALVSCGFPERWPLMRTACPCHDDLVQWYLSTYIHIYIHAYMFVGVNFEALATGKWYWIERGPVVFLCWMQHSNPGSL